MSHSTWMVLLMIHHILSAHIPESVEDTKGVHFFHDYFVTPLKHYKQCTSLSSKASQILLEVEGWCNSMLVWISQEHPATILLQFLHLSALLAR